MRGGGAAIVQRGGVRIALLHGMHETIGADAVIEHAHAASDHKFAINLIRKPKSRTEITERRMILDRASADCCSRIRRGGLGIVGQIIAGCDPTREVSRQALCGSGHCRIGRQLA